MHLQPSLESPLVRDFYDEILRGLSCRPAQIPCKYLYDKRGSELFNEICQLPEYYPTRVELELMERFAAQMAGLIGPEVRVVELGSGSGAKTQMLLGVLEDPVAYVPIDISADELESCAVRTQQNFPGLLVSPVCADYTSSIPILTGTRTPSRTLIYYPGSTIGNFHPPEAQKFLRRLLAAAGPRGELLIGVDLKKNPALIERAYNDARGVTAKFNLNLLHRLNRELAADFNPKAFVHDAPYLEEESCVEMRLISARPQEVAVAGRTFYFDEAEIIVTERSYKYSIFEFTALAKSAGWRCRKLWTDEENTFGIWLLRRS